MANVATPMPAPPLAPIIQTISEAATATNDVVHLVSFGEKYERNGL